MDAAASHSHHHHEMPATGGPSLGLAASATLHCLTGCAIGEVLGMAIGTALGFSDLATIALAVTLAFLFGYGLTSLPLLRAGLALSAVVPIALAAEPRSSCCRIRTGITSSAATVTTGSNRLAIRSLCSSIR